MIDNNNCFYISRLKNIVFLGQAQCFLKLQEINKKLKLNDIIVTCSDQKKFFNKEKNVFIFDQLDNKFKNFVKKNLIYLKHYLLVLVADGSLIMMI